MSPKTKKKIAHYLLLSLVISAGLIWYAVFQVEAQGGILRVYFFDVGQGDAIFVQAPNGNQVLIDGGPDNSVLSKLGEVMPFWDRSIDAIILSHPHADHIDGLIEVLRRYDVGIIVETGVNHSIPEYEEWKKLLADKKVKVIIAKSGQKLRLSDSAYIDILLPDEDFAGDSPKNIHDAMIISKLYYASTTILFMGDAEKRLEYSLLNSESEILNSNILKVGHHGSKTSSSEDFLKAVSPEAAIISAGAKNRYSHPHQEVLDRLQRLGINIFRTDADGDITLTSDGRQFSLKSAK